MGNRIPLNQAAAADRFERYVQRQDQGCWIWTGTRTLHGYGSFCDNGPKVLVHRWSYEQHVGPIPDGLVIDHLCRNPPCVNPDHLEPVTQRENLMRSPIVLSAINARKTHCVRGHEFTPENTYIQPATGKRRCRTCALAAEAVRVRISPKRRPKGQGG